MNVSVSYMSGCCPSTCISGLGPPRNLNIITPNRPPNPIIRYLSRTQSQSRYPLPQSANRARALYLAPEPASSTSRRLARARGRERTQTHALMRSSRAFASVRIRMRTTMCRAELPSACHETHPTDRVSGCSLHIMCVSISGAPIDNQILSQTPSDPYWKTQCSDRPEKYPKRRVPEYELITPPPFAKFPFMNSTCGAPKVLAS